MVYYLPLEPYQERYTHQLKDWTLTALERNGVPADQVRVIEPFGLGENAIIKNIGPLDYFRRTKWALLQVEQLIRELESKSFTSNQDVIYLQDMFHPGIEALFYVFAQKPADNRPRIYVQNCAQSMDIYDFTYPMIDWMRHYELMVDKFVDGVFVASEIHAELMRVAQFKAPIFVTGLPFDKNEVVSRLRNYGEEVKPWEDKSETVVFSSRFDKEKQPHFFLDLVEAAKTQPRFKHTAFVILQGGVFNSSDPSAIVRAKKMESEGKLKIYEKLSKEDYYKFLNSAKVQINTALQDFVSNTLNEASALKVKSLLPCFRSFPEAVQSDPRYLYIPFNLGDALDKLEALLLYSYDEKSVSYPACKNHKTLDNVVQILRGWQVMKDYNGI